MPTEHPTPIPTLAPVDSPFEADEVDVSNVGADLDEEEELSVDDTLEDVFWAEAKSVAWYRIETP